jgi:hypothetical protein
MQYIKPFIIATFHLGPPPLAVWAAHLWTHGHEGIAAWLGIVAGLSAVAMLARDWWLDEVAESLSPTRVWHRTSIEGPRPLPSFPVEENPSRIRIRPLVESVAPADADQEPTWTDTGVAS